MISRTSFITVGLAATLVACAGAPRDLAITPIPLIEETYEFWGFAGAAGAVAGFVSIGPDGSAYLHNASYGRCGETRINSRAIMVRCGNMSLTAFHQDGRLASKATVWVTVWNERLREESAHKGIVKLRPAG